jgi:3'-phosphoadenosine 5'-phosphosulfate sulfotransferase (PAPS reductase)/FAD synthetase
MKTEALKQALDKYKFDAALGGASIKKPAPVT